MTSNVDRQATPRISAAKYRLLVENDAVPTPRARDGAQGSAGPAKTPRTSKPVPRPTTSSRLSVVDAVWPIVLRVIGQPRTQGSKQALRRNDGTVFYREGGNAEAHRLFKSWRAAVADEGRRWLAGHGHPAAYDGAVRVDALFLLPKPDSRPKRERLARTGFDRDKLERAVHDGLSVDAPVIRNDSRICWGEIGKLWAVDTTPGAVIKIEPLAEDDWRRFPLVNLVWSDR